MVILLMLCGSVPESKPGGLPRQDQGSGKEGGSQNLTGLYTDMQRILRVNIGLVTSRFIF